MNTIDLKRSANRRTNTRCLIEHLESRCMLSVTGYGGAFSVFADASASETGLIGSYFNQNLGPVDELDWRATQPISGTRIDSSVFFPTNSFGDRSEVGITGGTDANWDSFSVQWDGYIQVFEAGTTLATRSDDSSRMWIDIDNDGQFEAGANELVDNNWGSPQIANTGSISVPLSPGTYGIRIQYQEDFLDNTFSLIANPVEPASEPDPTGPAYNHIVRIGYVIPQNRAPQSSGVANLQDLMPRAQAWYAEQMDRNGFGPKTFGFETEADGVTPKVHIVKVGVDDDFLQSQPIDIYTNTIAASKAAGLTIGEPGEAWLLIPESHVQNPDGSIDYGLFLGSGQESTGSHSGIVVFGSDSLFRLDDTSLVDNQTYDGQVVPELGPYPLVEGVSFPWFEGNSFSSIASSAQGAAIHELTHAFALGHDFRNDENFHGNLMGNGLRGFRGATHPDLYPQDDMRLAYASALVLNSSRYFFPDQPFTGSDDTRPGLGITTSGAVNPINGLLEINFNASDSGSGVTAALLRRNGNTIGELPLSGSVVIGQFVTPYYEPGVTDSYSISVYDALGNRRDAEVQIFVNPGFNRAPQPQIKVSPSVAEIGESVLLDASRTADPDHDNSQILVEWDLDGDGNYDTTLSTNKVLSTSFSNSGTYLVSARTTDPAGAQSISAPIAVRISDSAATGTLAAFNTAGAIAPTQADVVGYETTGSLRNVTTSIAPKLAQGVSVSDLVAGPGVTATNSWFDDRFAPRGWQSTSLADALAAGEYLSFTVSVNEGVSLDLTDIDSTLFTQNMRPRSFALLASATGFTSGDVITDFGGIVTGIQSFGQETRNANLSNVAALQNLTGTVEFRIYAYGATTNSFEAVGIGNQTGSEITLRGKLSTNSIEPESVTDAASVSPLVAGGGVSSTNSWFNDRFAPAGWSSTSLSGAIANDEYLSFSVTAKPGETIDVGAIDAMLFTQNQRPRDFALLSSVTGFNQSAVLTDFGGTVQGSGNFGQESRTADLSSIAGLQNITGTVEFRIYVYADSPNFYEAAGIGTRTGNDLVLSTAAFPLGAPSLDSATDAVFQLLGDVSGNGQVGFEDFLILSANFGGPGELAHGDLNADGTVNFADFLLLSQAF